MPRHKLPEHPDPPTVVELAVDRATACVFASGGLVRTVTDLLHYCDSEGKSMSHVVREALNVYEKERKS